MTSVDEAVVARVPAATPPPSRVLDWAIAAFSLWFIGGLFLDGWAHRNLSGLETFFTPWHAVMYSGFGALAVALVVTAGRNRLRNGAGVKLLPAGYDHALLGAGVFMAGGVGDMLWHTLFGIEVDVEALLSPTHLLLAVGIWMIVSAPVRSYRLQLRENPAPRWAESIPSIASVVVSVSLLTFFTQFAHPATEAWVFNSASDPDLAWLAQEMGVASLVLTGALLTGAVLLARPLRWPFGAMTVLLTLNALGMSALSGDFTAVPAGAVAGLVADFFVARAQKVNSSARVVVLGALVPAAFVAVLHLAHWLTGGLDWSVHLWTGSIAFVACFGGLLALVAQNAGPHGSYSTVTATSPVAGSKRRVVPSSG